MSAVARGDHGVTVRVDNRHSVAPVPRAQPSAVQQQDRRLSRITLHAHDLERWGMNNIVLND